MIQYLGHALDEFPGTENQTWWFAHTINLIAKSILKPFEVWKMKGIQEFKDVVQGLADTSEEENTEKEDEEEEDDDDDEEGKDEGEDEFDMSLEPIRSMLLKVCLHFIDPNPKLADKSFKLRKIAFAIKNSPTILLPAWCKTTPAHGLPSFIISQGILTC